MAKTQTIVAFFVVLVFILATLFLNEAVYSERDLNVRLDVHSYSNISMAPADCRFTRATNVGETSLGKDNFSVEDDIARELLYGGFSARGATISGIILSVFAFILSVIGVGLDLDMTAAKYPSGAWSRNNKNNVCCWNINSFVGCRCYIVYVIGFFMVFGCLGSAGLCTIWWFGYGSRRF